MIQHPSENRENGCFSGRHREESLRNRNAFVTYALIAINVAVFFFDEIFFGSTLDTGVLIRAGGAYVPYISSGQYWRLFTAMFMHSGMQHLLNNMVMLFVLGTSLEYLLGHVKYAVLYVLCGLAANIAAWRYYAAADANVVSVGASGAIFAVMGAVIYIVIRNKGQAAGLSIRQMLVMLAFSVYFSFIGSNIAATAHIAGLISGFIAAVLLYRKPRGNQPHDRYRSII